MSEFKRRKFLKTSAGLAAGAAAGPLIWVKDANAQAWNNTPEKGAKLRVLRWSRFAQGDIDQYMKNVEKFKAKYNIDVRVDNIARSDLYIADEVFVCGTAAEISSVNSCSSCFAACSVSAMNGTIPGRISTSCGLRPYAAARDFTSR